MLGDDISGTIEVYNRNKSGINLYPNPVADVIHIDKTGIVEIVNITGQVVFTQVNKEIYQEIDISELAKGIYFVRIADNDQVLPEKIMVQPQVL